MFEAGALWVVLCISLVTGDNLKINPNIGTIVKERGHINGAVTKLHIIAKLNKIPDLPSTTYPSPCRYLPLATEMFSTTFSLQHQTMTKEYLHMCQGYEKIRTIYLNLRNIMKKEESEVLGSLQQLRLRRERRSLGGFLRSTLGIAHLNKQKRLQNVVNNLAEQSFNHEGSIRGLDFMLKVQNQKITVLNNVTKQYLQLMKNVTESLTLTRHRINDRQVIARHTLTWIADAMTSGVLYNQMLEMHNRVLKTRVKAIGDLAQGKLTPDIIRPDELKRTLTKLQEQLKKKYVRLQLTKFNIWDYYALDNIISFVRNGSLYLSIPVSLQMFDQTYTLYEINTFMVPVESENPQATIIMDYIDLLAVNTQQNTYFAVTRQFIAEYCRGKTVLRCTSLFMSHDMTKSPSCASMIFKNELNEIQRLCHIGFIEIKPSIAPSIYDFHNSSILLINPAKQMIFARCTDNYKRKIPITNNTLMTVNLSCFCYLFNDQISTPIYVGPECLNQNSIQITSNPHINILYLAHMLNKTISEIQMMSMNMSTMNQLPKLEVPDFMESISLLRESSEPIYDLKKIIALQKNDYMNTIYGRVSKNHSELRGLNVFKIIIYTVTTITILVVVGGLILGYRVKGLSQLLAIGKMIPIARAATLNHDHAEREMESWNISIEILSLVVLSLTIIYWIYKHAALLKRMFKYCAFPVNEFKLDDKPPALSIILYIVSMTEWCYLDLDTIYALPHEIKLMQSEIDVDIALHESCCSTYITLTHERMGLKLGDTNTNIFLFNKAITVPVYSRFALKKILSSEYKVQILIGENRIYRAYDIKLKI